MLFEEFQDGHGHLGYQNGRLLAILNLCCSDASHPVSAQSDMVCEEMSFEEFQDGHPSWTSEKNDFSNSEVLFHYDASHQVLAQSDLRFERRCCLKNFKMVAILDIGMERF